jgi:hypothetical protein
MCPFVYVIQNLYNVIVILYWSKIFGPIHTVSNIYLVYLFIYLIELNGLLVAKSSLLR